MKRYPFVINRKQPRATVQVTEASNYNVALNKVLELHPGKRVSTKFAKNVERFHNALPSLMETVIDADKIKPFKYKPFKQILNTMDLITARVEAAAQSLKEKKFTLPLMMKWNVFYHPLHPKILMTFKPSMFLVVKSR